MAGYIFAITGFCLQQTPSPSGDQFLWFIKTDLLQFHMIFLLFDSWKQTFGFFRSA